MDQDHENISWSPITPKSKGNVISYKTKMYYLQRKGHDHFFNIILKGSYDVISSFPFSLENYKLFVHR